MLTAKTFAHRMLVDTEQILYMVPEGKTAIIKELLFTNITSSAQTVDVLICDHSVESSNENYFLKSLALEANETKVFPQSVVIESSKEIRALCSTHSAVNIYVSGALSDELVLFPNFMYYQGTWDPTTNTPVLNDGFGQIGKFYVASVSGTIDFGHGDISFGEGDWIVYDGEKWTKSTNIINTVDSVNGRIGEITLDKTDVGLDNVPNVDATVASNIVQDSTHQFITDTERTDWDNKTDKNTDGLIVREQTPGFVYIVKDWPVVSNIDLNHMNSGDYLFNSLNRKLYQAIADIVEPNFSDTFYPEQFLEIAMFPELVDGKIPEEQLNKINVYEVADSTAFDSLVPVDGAFRKGDVLKILNDHKTYMNISAEKGTYAELASNWKEIGSATIIDDGIEDNLVSINNEGGLKDSGLSFDYLNNKTTLLSDWDPAASLPANPTKGTTIICSSDYTHGTLGEIKAGDFIQYNGSAWVVIHQTTKADIVESAIENNFVSFDSLGNIKDSGCKDSDYADASHDHTVSEITDFDPTTKADIISGGTDGNLVSRDSTGNIRDDGVSVNDSGTTTTDLWTANKIMTELGNKENSVNKVTSFQTTPDDAHYASEKLVKDSLELKADDSETVHTSGDETVTGIKNFTGSLQHNGINVAKIVTDTDGKWIVDENGVKSPLSNVELSELAEDYQAKGISKPYIFLDNPSQDQTVDLDITPITWVNELGVDGSFETDTNGDGLADGINITGRTTNEISTDSVFGDYSQKITSLDVANNEKMLYTPCSQTDGDVLYISVYAKVDESNTTKSVFLYSNYITSGRFLKYLDCSGSTGFVKGSWTHTATSFNTLYFGLNTSIAGEQAWFDGLQVINLTKMGELPTSLANYLNDKYSPETAWTRFDQLSQEALDEIAPDYVHSIQTVGYSFENGEYSPEIVNKGRNLIDLQTTKDRNDYGSTFWEIIGDTIIVLTTLDGNRGVAWNIPCKPNTNYTLTWKVTSLSDNVQDCYIQGEPYRADLFTKKTFNSGANKNIQIELYQRATKGTFKVENFQLEEGSEATDYQAPSTHQETLPELWGYNGVFDSPDSKKWKRVKLIDAVNSAGVVDWSWAESAGAEMIDFVNELGTDGSFETDTDDDGIADGIGTISRTTNEISTDSVFGDYSQKITSLDVAVSEKMLTVSCSQTDGDVLYISVYAKVDESNTTKSVILFSDYIASGRFWEYLDCSGSTGFVKGSWTHTATSFNTLYFGLNTSIAGEQAWFDGLQVINLTSLGALPPKLKAYLNNKYSASWVNFEDISKDAADEIIPDYVHGTQTMGWQQAVLLNTQDSGTYTGENKITKIGDPDDTGWAENDDVLCVFDNTGGTNNHIVDTYNGSTQTDSVELYQNPNPQLMVEHGKNHIFGDNSAYIYLQTAYNQYQLEREARERNNKLLEVEERNNGLWGNTRTGKSFLINPAIITQDSVGIYWDGSADPTCERTGVATNVSDFDLIYPFNQRRRVAVDGSGNVVGIHSSFDTNFWQDGSAVDWSAYETDGWNCMVQVPKFWYRQFKDSGGWHFEISAYPKSGFAIHPAFLNSNGTQRDYYYISAFEGWADSTIAEVDRPLRSLPNKQPVSSTNVTGTFTAFQGYATNAGLKLMDWNILWAEQLQFYIEIGTLYSQDVYLGITNLAGGTVNHSQNTGHTLSLGNASGEVVITPENGATGATETYPFSYRGHENFYGNILEWVDGMVWDWNAGAPTITVGGVSYTLTDTHLIEEDGEPTDFEETPGFVTKITNTSGSSSTYTTDYLWRSELDDRLPLFGGRWSDGGQAGGLYLSLGHWASASYRSFGARAAL